jgi:hypothetical protein
MNSVPFVDGSFAAVYKAKLMDQDVAVKVVKEPIVMVCHPFFFYEQCSFHDVYETVRPEQMGVGPSFFSLAFCTQVST